MNLKFDQSFLKIMHIIEDKRKAKGYAITWFILVRRLRNDEFNQI